VKNILWLIVFMGLSVGCVEINNLTPRSREKAKPALSDKSKKILDSVLKDSRDFAFTILYYYKPVVGIQLGTKADAEQRFTYAQVDHSEAVRITQYLAEVGYLDHTEERLTAGKSIPGWWAHFTYKTHLDHPMYLGADNAQLFKRSGILNIRSVLSPQNKKVWDRFLADAKKKVAPNKPDADDGK